ncbi:hypothetical protein VTJ49DRAFT_253 [Mycothermus thermophilus]|uniref:Uncharacterized protein n=1 Tax=Humicola insolens TaxID=85995 RepID=A0ABR3VFL8_HUMIN
MAPSCKPAPLFLDPADRDTFSRTDPSIPPLARRRFTKPGSSTATYQPPILDPAAISADVNRVLDAFLGPVGIHTENSTLATLRALAQIDVRPLSDTPEHRAEDAPSGNRGLASQLLGLDKAAPTAGDAPKTQKSPVRRSKEVVNIISKAAYKIVTHPTTIITPAVLHEYVRLQARLGKPGSLPEVLHLFATKPTPKMVSGNIEYNQRNPDKAENAVDSTVAEAALDAALEAKDFETAIGILEKTYATKAFRKSKLVKKALIPGFTAVATPAAIYVGATELAKLQNALEPRIATGFAFAGALAYVGFTATIGMVAHFTANDQMKRVTWVPGTPLRHRWLYEEERAALDKIACAFGFSEEHRWGEEEGEEFQFLREYILSKSMILDALYAGAFAHFDRKSFDFMYWFLFVVVLGLLILSSWRWASDNDEIHELGEAPGSYAHKSRMRRALVSCGAYAAVAITSVVLEAYALMGLQFCQGEDLMVLYWASWTMLQIGSTAAMVGILLAAFYQLRGMKAPPWALALGTPILVAAGFGHAANSTMASPARRFLQSGLLKVRRSLRSLRPRFGSPNPATDEENANDLPMSRAQTLRADDDDDYDGCGTMRSSPCGEGAEITAKFLGYSDTGGPILRFDEKQARQIDPERGEILGRGDNGDVIVAFKKNMTVVSTTPSIGISRCVSPSPSPTPPPPASPGPAITISSSPTLIGSPRTPRSMSPFGSNNPYNRPADVNLATRLQAVMALNDNGMAVDDIDRQKESNRRDEITSSTNANADSIDISPPENCVTRSPSEVSREQPRGRSIRIIHHDHPRSRSRRGSN